MKVSRGTLEELFFHFLLERSWHIWRRRARHARVYLKSIVHEPLQAGERADHDDTCHQAAPDADHAHLGEDAADGGRGVLIELGDDGVRRVRHHGAQHARDVAGAERHDQLLHGRAVLARLGDHVRVQVLQRHLERGELHHRVGHLPAPQRSQTAIEYAETCTLTGIALYNISSYTKSLF